MSHTSLFFERRSGVKGETTNIRSRWLATKNQKIRHRWHSNGRNIIKQAVKSPTISKISMHQWPKTAKKSRSTKISWQWSNKKSVEMTRNGAYVNVDIDRQTPISFFDDPSKKYFYYRCQKIGNLRIDKDVRYARSAHMSPRIERRVAPHGC